MSQSSLIVTCKLEWVYGSPISKQLLKSPAEYAAEWSQLVRKQQRSCPSISDILSTVERNVYLVNGFQCPECHSKFAIADGDSVYERVYSCKNCGVAVRYFVPCAKEGKR